MNMKNIFYCLLPGLLLGACSNKVYEKTGDSVIVKVQHKETGGPRLVRLQVMGDKLIRVSATADSKFADPQSLIVVPQKKQTSFAVVQNGDTITVSTEEVKASVLASTGEVWFTDKNGELILQENKGGGKTFTPIEVEGTKGYTVCQVFESPEDEAFYGLGQHQADEFNYKGKNEELFQYNTKVSVPFVVSNKNYGILLDSYSFCRFGNPNDYSQLNRIFKLYDKTGQEGALTGTYVPKKGETLVRREDSIYFENLKTIENLPKKLPLMGAKVTYEGEIEPAQTGEFKFILYYAGYVKVYLNNEPVVPERWRTAWNPNSYKFAAHLEAGKRVPLKIEWQPDGGQSYCGLRALTPVNPEEQGKQSWWSEMTKQLDYYFMAGENMDDVISGYRSLTGKSPVMPKWAMGFWQSREKYNTQEEMLGALKGFRDRKIPLDNIVLDWNHWPENAWGSHEFDKARFPDPKAMVDSIHAMHARMMISVWPKFYVTTEHFKEFDENGWMYQQSVKDSLKDWVGPGYHYGFYDAYDPDARKLFWQQMYEREEGESIMVCPLSMDTHVDSEMIQQFEVVKEVISNVRSIRLQKNIAQKETLELQVVGENPVDAFNLVIMKMCNLSAIDVVDTKTEGAASFMVGTTEYAVPLGNMIDVEAEIARMEAELKHKEGFLQGVMKKLSNEKFVNNAPAAVLELERKKQADAESIINSLKESIAALKK